MVHKNEILKMIPQEIQNFIEEFSKLPAIGPRMATRLAFYLAGLNNGSIEKLEGALGGIRKLDRCPDCFFFKEKEEKICGICKNPERDRRIIAIVEKETDLLSIEKTGDYRGLYLVLGHLNRGGVLEEEHKSRLRSLRERAKNDEGGKISEIIIALGSNTFGDFVAGLIEQGFKGIAEKITRLGRGIPTGGEVEFADEDTLRSALEGRR